MINQNLCNASKTIIAIVMVSMITACSSLPIKMSANTTFDKPDEQLNAWGVDLFTSSKTILVPTSYVQTLVHGEQKASNNGAHSKVNVTVKGMTEQLGQELATILHQDLVSRLRDSGWNVLTYKDIKSNPEVAGDLADIDIMKLDKDLGFVGFETNYAGAGDKIWLLSSPKGVPVFDFDFTGTNPPIVDFESIGREIGANPIIPRYVFMAPVMYSETSDGYKRSTASAGLVPAMEMLHGFSYIMYPYGSVYTKQTIRLSENIGDIKKVSSSSSDDRSLFVGNIFRSMSKGEYVMTLDVTAYKKAALQAGKDLNKVAVEAINAALPQE